jgi:hypothetical protein
LRAWVALHAFSPFPEPWRESALESYSLDQWIWTHDDLERMGWHDAAVHAMGYALAGEWEFALDIDYILERLLVFA